MFEVVLLVMDGQMHHSLRVRNVERHGLTGELHLDLGRSTSL
jgi:hypothetical protein